MFVLGYAISLFICCFMARKSGYTHIIYSSFYGIIGMLIGAKAFFFFSRLPKIILGFDLYIKLWKTDFTEALNYAFGGLVFYGGLIGFCLGVYIYSKQYKVHLNYLIYNMTPFIPLTHCFGRIGCFMAGCCYGIPYDGPLSVQFPYNENIKELNLYPRFPTQLCEAMLNLVIFVILIFLRNKNIFRKPKEYLGIYIFLYSVMRFGMEFLRGDGGREIYGYLSTSQIISIILLPLALLLIIDKNKS